MNKTLSEPLLKGRDVEPLHIDNSIARDVEKSHGRKAERPLQVISAKPPQACGGVRCKVAKVAN